MWFVKWPHSGSTMYAHSLGDSLAQKPVGLLVWWRDEIGEFTDVVCQSRGRLSASARGLVVVMCGFRLGV